MKCYRGVVIGIVALFALGAATSAKATIISVASVSGTVTDNFDALPGGNVAGLIAQTGASYGEHFAGQSVATGTGFDVLSGAPSAPLTVLANASLADNVGIVNSGGSNVIYGDLSNLVGEGALSVLFTQDATQLGFNIIGVDGGGALTVQFFDRSGASLGTITQALPSNGFFGFTGNAGEHIAGISITNTDPAGIGYDNVTFDQAAPTAVPEPMSLFLLGTGLAGVIARTRRKKHQAQ